MYTLFYREQGESIGLAIAIDKFALPLDFTTVFRKRKVYLNRKVGVFFLYGDPSWQPVVYAENFHGEGSFSGIWQSFVFGVRSLWRHHLTSYSCFQTNVLAKFFDIIFLHPLALSYVIALYKLLALQVRINFQTNIQKADPQMFSFWVNSSFAEKQVCLIFVD